MLNVELGLFGEVNEVNDLLCISGIFFEFDEL